MCYYARIIAAYWNLDRMTGARGICEKSPAR